MSREGFNTKEICAIVYLGNLAKMPKASSFIFQPVF